MITINYKKAFLMVLVFTSGFLNYSIGQDSIRMYPIHSVEWTDTQDDLSFLAKLTGQARIIGMGKSTYGTHEFTTLRHRMLAWLVENQGFNTLFLEADYANCRALNDYIQGEEIDPIAAIKAVESWPLMHHEMLNVVEWMRKYNINHPAASLQLVGVDMKLFHANLDQLDALLRLHGQEGTNPKLHQKINDHDFPKISKRQLHPYRSIAKAKPSVLKSEDSTLMKHYENALSTYGSVYNPKRSRTKGLVLS